MTRCAPPLSEECSLKPENRLMFAIQRNRDFLHRAPELRPPVEPGTMHAVAGAINIAPPDAFQAHNHVASQTWP